MITVTMLMLDVMFVVSITAIIAGTVLIIKEY